MCGAMVGCVVCEGYAFFIKNARLLNSISDFDRKESREGRRLDENYSIKSRLSNRNDIRDDFRDESRNDFRNNFRNDLRDSFHRGRFRQSRLAGSPFTSTYFSTYAWRTLVAGDEQPAPW